MTEAIDTYVPGTVVAASLLPQAVDNCDPWLRRLLIGPQFFVKQSDGRWCPQGCQLGRACRFDWKDCTTKRARSEPCSSSRRGAVPRWNEPRPPVTTC